MTGQDQQPVNQVIVRNLLRAAPACHALWVNPGTGEGWQTAVSAGIAVKLLCQQYGPYRFHQRAGADAEFAAFPDEGAHEPPWIILNLPRQKALLRMMLDWAASALPKEGVLWLAGEKRAGIKSAGRHLKAFFATVVKLDNARHCSLYEVRRPLPKAAFEPLEYRRTWPLDCAGTRLEVCSYPGVFAHGRLDAGSERLLAALGPEKLGGDVLDFGAGAGVVGAFLARRNPAANITFLDSSALALRSCAETAAANGLDARVLASDGLSEVRGRYDVIVSNPPIHAGVRTETTLSQRLLAGVHEHLRPGGRLLLVANVHLPYENWLRQRFSAYRVISADDSYKVLSATRSR